MIGERSERRNDRDRKECADPVERTQLHKIVKEEFEQRDAEQCERSIAPGARRFPDADEQQAEREERPRDSVAHVASEMAGKLKREHALAGRAEKVGDLDVDEEERENGAEGVEERRDIDAEDSFTRWGEQVSAAEQTRCHRAEAVEIPVENRGAAARVVLEHGGVETEPREGCHEQRGADEAKAVMWHALEEPEQRRTFQRPAQCQPLAIKLNREHERDEKQRHAPKERELVEACAFVVGRRTGLLIRGLVGTRSTGRDTRTPWRAQDGGQTQQRRDRKKRGEDAGKLVRPRGGHEPVDERKLGDATERSHYPRPGARGEAAAEYERIGGENRVEKEIPGERNRRVFHGEAPRAP